MWISAKIIRCYQVLICKLSNSQGHYLPQGRQVKVYRAYNFKMEQKMPSKRITKGMNPYKKMFSFADNEVPRSYEGLDSSLNYLEQLILFKGRWMKAKQTWTDRTFLFVRKSSMPDDDTFVRKEDFALVAWIPNVFDVILDGKK